MASHRRPPASGFTGGARVALLSAAVATAAAALGTAPAGADPSTTGPAATSAQVDRLYEQAEKATERYNEAAEHVDELGDQVARARERAARGQEDVNRMRDAVGSLAGAHYRSGGVDPALALLLSGDPDTYLDRAALLERLGDREAAVLTDLRRAQRRLGQERSEAARKLAELERTKTALARHKRAVEAKLATAERLLSSLSAAQRAAYGAVSRSGRAVPDPAGGAGPSSARAAAAVAAARSALGKPYVWGANGPHGFDCSGLTQWSYARAGVGLPRTSQAQRYAGRQVPLSQARPGDLVTYRSDASHVAMYVGNGQVVHAPYPGAAVRHDPVGMMPIASVTRP